MAGEWIPVDCNLGTKPEVLELVDETGLPIEVVGWRLIQLWSWAALNSSDGTIRATPRRVATVAGGDEAFWLAVERVGWVSFLSGTVVINGWDKRFSQAAKARSMHARRQDSYRWRSRDGGPSQGCDAAASLQERRGEDRREEEIQPAAPVPASKPPKASRSPAKSAVDWAADAGWTGITDADRAEWATAFPGAVLDQELAKATSWLKANPKRAGRRNWRRFIVGWLQRCQDKGGTHREPGRRPDDKPPPKVWKDEYRPAPYRRPHEVAALASAVKLKEEDL
jgi:hypothetical protein